MDKKKGSYSKDQATPLLYSNFVEVFISPKFELVSALATIMVTKDIGFLISEALLNIFEIYSDQTFELMKWAVCHEIEQATTVTGLFRGASFSARLMSTFYKKAGAGYLKQVLGPWLIDLIDRPRSYEIDPLKALPTDIIEENFKKLLEIAEQVLDRILNSVDQCPVAIRQLLSHAKEKVHLKFPDKSLNQYPVIGSSIFLRYFCPAIVAPTEHGLLLDTPGTDIRRALVLVSKLLQNLANEQQFEKKEEFMLPFNNFIIENVPRLREFFSQITQPPRRDSNPSPKLFALPTEEMLVDNIGILYAISSEHKEKISKFIECNYPANFASLFISKLDDALTSTTMRKKGKSNIITRTLLPSKARSAAPTQHAHTADEEGFRTMPRKSLQDFQRELQAQQDGGYSQERRHSSAEADYIEQQFKTSVEQFVHYFGSKLKEKDKQLQEVLESPGNSPRSPRSESSIPRSASAENLFIQTPSYEITKLRNENESLLRQVKALTEENGKLRDLVKQQQPSTNTNANTNHDQQLNQTTYDLVAKTRSDVERIAAILAQEEERKQRKRTAREARRARNAEALTPREEGPKEGEKDAVKEAVPLATVS